MTEIERLIDDFKRLRWKSDPMSPALKMALASSTDAVELATRIVDELPEAGTFHDAILSLIPLKDWPRLVEQSIRVFTSNRESKSAESVIAYGALQCVEVLYPYLDRLFELGLNAGSHVEVWPWRNAGKDAVERLISITEDPMASPDTRLKAWNCLLESRSPEALQAALIAAEQVDRNSSCFDKALLTSGQ